MGSDTFQNFTESRHPFGMARQLPFFLQKEVCNQGKEVFIFMVESSLVDTRSAFPEITWRAHLAIEKISMSANRQKWEIFNFPILVVMGFKGSNPLQGHRSL